MIIRTTLFLYFATAWAQQGSSPSGGQCSSGDPATCCSVAGQSEGQIDLENFSVRYTCGAYANPSNGQGHVATSSRECASLCAGDPSCRAASWSLANSHVRCYFAKGEYDIRQNNNWVLLENPTETEPETCPPGTFDVNGRCEVIVPGQCEVEIEECTRDTARLENEKQQCLQENYELARRKEQCREDQQRCQNDHAEQALENQKCENSNSQLALDLARERDKTSDLRSDNDKLHSKYQELERKCNQPPSGTCRKNMFNAGTLQFNTSRIITHPFDLM